MDMITLACVDSSLTACIWSVERLELKRRGRERYKDAALIRGSAAFILI